MDPTKLLLNKLCARWLRIFSKLYFQLLVAIMIILNGNSLGNANGTRDVMHSLFLRVDLIVFQALSTS